MFKRGDKKQTKNQAGIVSLIVVSILAVVLGLVAVGFSKLMDREARRALDNELSAQAYYSSIAGLHDAQEYLKAGGGSLTGCSDWKSSSLGLQYFASNLGGGGTAKYSCLSIDTTPNDLVFGDIKKDQSVTFNLTEPSMKQMYFGWANSPNNLASYTPLGSTGDLPQYTTEPPGATGLLEVNMFPSYTNWDGNPRGAGNSTDGVLEGLSRTYYMYPSGSISCPSGGGTSCTDYTQDNGNFVPGGCRANNTNPLTGSTTNATVCNAYIDKLMSGNVTYTVRLTARYQDLYVMVQAASGAGSPISNLHGSQAVIDVTGQGTDVLQRIQSTVNLDQSSPTPLYGIQSMVGICKGFQVEMQDQGVYGPSFNYFSSNYDPTNSTCTYPANTVGTGVGGISSDQPPHQGLPPPQVPLIVTAVLSSNSGTNLLTGQSAQLTWTSTNANNCSGSGFSTGGATSGNTTVGPLSTPGSYTYTLSCNGFGQTATSQVIINVTRPPTPSSTITVNGGTATVYVYNGGSAALQWSSSNASTCAGNGFSTGGATSGATSTGALSSGTHNFYVTCYDSTGGQPTNSNVVTVVAYPPCTGTINRSGNKVSATPSCGTVSSYNLVGSYYECDYIGPVPQGCYTVYVNNYSMPYTFPNNGSSGGFRWTISNYQATYTITGSYGTGSTSTIYW